MSKSAPDARSRILLTDSPEDVIKKLKGAMTDSDPTIVYDPVARPGTANLLSILAACEGHERPSTTPGAVAMRFAGKGHAELKKEVAEAVIAFLEGPRKELERIKRDVTYLQEVEAEGARKAREISGKTLEEVRKRLGLDRSRL
jgi:tryptophanyl-tRNA synthetase